MLADAGGQFSKQKRGYFMITSVANPRVKQVVQWQSKSRERKKDNIFLAEGIKMYEEAPEASVREVYIIEETLQKMQQEPVL